MNNNLDNFNIFNLREISPESLKIGADKLKASSETVTIEYQSVPGGAVDYFAIRSGNAVYTVGVLADIFGGCSCRDFQYSKHACKHLALVMPIKCVECRGVSVKGYEDKCKHCEQATAPYLRPSLEKKPERIGNIRI